MGEPSGAARSAPWTSDEPFCELRYDGTMCPIRARVRLTEEVYQSHTLAREFVPLTVKAGTRTKDAYIKDVAPTT